MRPTWPPAIYSKTSTKNQELQANHGKAHSAHILQAERLARTTHRPDKRIGCLPESRESPEASSQEIGGRSLARDIHSGRSRNPDRTAVQAASPTLHRISLLGQVLYRGGQPTILPTASNACLDKRMRRAVGNKIEPKLAILTSHSNKLCFMLPCFMLPGSKFPKAGHQAAPTKDEVAGISCENCCKEPETFGWPYATPCNQRGPVARFGSVLATPEWITLT